MSLTSEVIQEHRERVMKRVGWVAHTDRSRAWGLLSDADFLRAMQSGEDGFETWNTADKADTNLAKRYYRELCGMLE